MAAWDNVQSPGPPAPPSYAAPLVDFSNIGNLYKTQFEGAQQRRTTGLQNAFPEGLPKDANGQPDIKAITDTLAKLGGADQAQAMIPLLMQQQIINQPSPEANPVPSPQTPPRVPIPQHGIPDRPPPDRTGSVQGGDNGQNTLMSVIGDAGVPDDKAGYVASTIASRLKIDPNAPITDPAMRANVARQVKAYQAQAQAQPQQAAAPQTLPPGYTEAEAQRLEELSRLNTEASRKQEILKTGSGAAYKARAEDLAKQAAEIRKGILERGPGALEQKRQEEINKLEIEQGQKTYNGIQASATQYERSLKPYLDTARSILNDPNSYTGIGSAISLNVNRVRAAFGDQKAAMMQEALQKVTASSVLGQINQQRDELMEAGGQSSRIFSQQVSLVEKAAPALATTLGGNRFLVEVSSRMGDQSLEIARMAREYRAKNRVLDTKFDDQLSKYLKANPLFTKQEMDNPALLGAPTAPSSIKSKDGARAWAKGMGLNPGDPIRTHDGKIQAVP